MKIANQASLYTQTAHPAGADKREAENKHNNVSATPVAETLLSASPRKSCPAWLKEAMFRDDTAVLTKGRIAHAEGSDSSRRWTDDQWAADHPMNQFRESIHQRLALRWTHDRSAAFDQIGSSTYADMRRQQLQSIPGAGHLAEQYALLTVSNYVPVQPPHPQQKMQHGLRIDHNNSAKYQRDVPHPELRKQCLGIYQSLGHKHPASQVLFVNSKTNASRILARLRHDHLKSASRLDRLKIASGLERNASAKVKTLHPGLVAIEFKNGADLRKAEEALKLLGGRPSSYEVSKLAYLAEHPLPSTSKPEIGVNHRKTLLELLREERSDNHKTLHEMFGNEDKGVISTLQSLPEGHAMRAIANCTASLLGGLQKALEKKADTPEFKTDPLIENALNALTNVARTLPTMTEDSTRFFPAYAAMLEELHLLLAAVKPYGESDFKKAAADMLKTRAGPALEKLHIPEPETYLLSSGMEAISMGIHVARKLSGTKRIQPLADQEKLPDYFETLKLKSEGRKWLDKDRVRIAPLNPSSPRKKADDDDANNWNAEKLVQQTIAWLTAGKMDASSPAVLVLDATIEQQKLEGKSDLETVLGKLGPYIDDGRLKIVLCKSYQKYTSLGNAKIMAGGITVLAKDDSKTRAATTRLQKAEKDLGWIHNDESQLLTHFMTHAHGSELDLIGEAAKNAAFIDKFCFDAVRRSGRGDVSREEELPFLIVTDEAVNYGKGLLSRQVVYRDSFGFLPTSIVDVDQGAALRITAGREPREELVEKLYGYGWLLDARLKRFTPADAKKEAERIAADAMQVVLRETDVMLWAPAALQVLRNRASDGTGENAAATGKCEALLDEIAGMPKNPEVRSGDELAQRKALLKQELETALNESEPQAENLLSDRLRIVGSAFAPRLAEGIRRENDVNAMHMAIHRERDGSPESSSALDDYTRARYASNAIASIVAMSGMAFEPGFLPDDEWQDLESLYSAALSAGLPGVSSATRAHIVLDWSRLNRENLRSPDKAVQHAAVNELVRHVRLSPYRETGAKVLAGIPDNAFASLERPAQRQLVNTLFAPLDVASRLTFIGMLARDKEFEKLSACIEKFGEDLKHAEEGASTLLFPDNLSDPAGNLVDEPRPITPEKRDEIREQLLSAILVQRHEGLGARMESWAPWICHDEKSAGQLAAVAHAFETAQSAPGILSDAQNNSLSDQMKLLPQPYRRVMEHYLEVSDTAAAL